MSSQQHPEFRLGSVLATSFTATLTERAGLSVERLPEPQRLVDWLAIFGLYVDSCSADELVRGKELREAIHAVVTAAATGAVLPTLSVDVINSSSSAGSAFAELTSNRTRRWVLRSSTVADALSVIARDAIDIVSGERDGRIALCASNTCRAAFFDTSRSRTRRWCEMNTCGNKEKKARFLANQRSRAVSAAS